MKILHTADVHLEKYDDERWKALEKLVEIAKKENIELFVISGDLFNKKVDANNLRPKIRDVFSRGKFQIILIPGNHDAEVYQEGMYFGENVKILRNLENPFVYNDHLAIWGLPFEQIEGDEILSRLYSIKDALNKYTTNILLYHGELLDAFFSREDFGDEGESRYMPVKLSYFKELNFQYVLAGHFHSKFDVKEIEDGRYFVYPGSPISITKKEVGRRKVNIFEAGEPPREYPLDTPFFEEINIDLDPFENTDPFIAVKERMEEIPKEAKIILTIGGYINGEISETEFKERIKEIMPGRAIEWHFLFKDIKNLLNDDLFKKFVKKVEQGNYDEERKRELRDLAIKAMMKVGL